MGSLSGSVRRGHKGACTYLHLLSLEIGNGRFLCYVQWEKTDRQKDQKQYALAIFWSGGIKICMQKHTKIFKHFVNYIFAYIYLMNHPIHLIKIKIYTIFQSNRFTFFASNNIRSSNETFLCPFLIPFILCLSPILLPLFLY